MGYDSFFQFLFIHERTLIFSPNGLYNQKTLCNLLCSFARKGLFRILEIAVNEWQTIGHPPAKGLYDDEDLEKIISYQKNINRYLQLSQHHLVLILFRNYEQSKEENGQY